MVRGIGGKSANSDIREKGNRSDQEIVMREGIVAETNLVEMEGGIGEKTIWKRDHLDTGSHSLLLLPTQYGIEIDQM